MRYLLDTAVIPLRGGLFSDVTQGGGPPTLPQIWTQSCPKPVGEAYRVR